MWEATKMSTQLFALRIFQKLVQYFADFGNESRKAEKNCDY